MMMADTIEVRDEEIVMIKDTMTIILWYVSCFLCCTSHLLLCLEGLMASVMLMQAPSATVVVKGLSQKTTEEDLYQILVLATTLSFSLNFPHATCRPPNLAVFVLIKFLPLLCFLFL